MKRLIFIVLISIFISPILMAESYFVTKYVKVVKHKRVTRVVTKEEPYQDCYYESVPVKYTEYVDEYVKNPAAPILGGVLGGVIGHQFGGGKGKDVATAVGAIGGAMIGQKNYGVKHYRRPVTRVRYEQKKVCKTYYRTKKVRVRRWKNIGYLNGKKIVKISKERLYEIPVKVKVSY